MEREFTCDDCGAEVYERVRIARIHPDKCKVCDYLASLPECLRVPLRKALSPVTPWPGQHAGLAAGRPAGAGRA